MRCHVLKLYLALSALSVCVWSIETEAVQVSQAFYGVDVQVVGEFVNGTKVDDDSQEFAPLFLEAQTMSGSITYDTDQPDIWSEDAANGLYRIGTLSVSIEEIELDAVRSSTFMQISPFNGTWNDEFFAYVNGIDDFSNAVFLPIPRSFWVSLYGSTSMLFDDQLPTNPIDWTFGNLSFSFLDDDGNTRQVLMTFVPAPDSDNDGVNDDIDWCLGTPEGAVVNVFGCSIDQYCPCEEDWKNHGQYVREIVSVAKAFLEDGLISEKEKAAVVSRAARSDCGKKK